MTDAAEINWYSDEAATFGDRIAAARDAQGLSQKSLARKLGVATRTLEAWEHDLSEPRANRLQMLAGVLNVSLPWLLTGEGEGLAAPVDETAPSDLRELLAELRSLKTQMNQSADRLGVLEKRLKAVLTETDA